MIQAADEILRIAVTAMSYAVKAVTTERGLDAGSYMMVVYGGAGPFARFSDRSRDRDQEVLIPYARIFLAYGMLFSDLRYDYVRSCFRKLEEVSFEEIEELYSSMEEEGQDAISTSAIRPEAIVVERAADMRYVGQEHAVTVELPSQFFGKRIGTRSSAVSTRSMQSAMAPRHQKSQQTSLVCELPYLVRCASRRATLSTKERSNHRKKPCERQRMCFSELKGSSRRQFSNEGSCEAVIGLNGPALIEEHASTTVVQPGDVLTVDGLGNLQILIGSEHK